MRYLVYEMEGWPISPSVTSRGTGHREGVTVWVSDELNYGKEVKVWRSEDIQKGVYWTRRQRMLAEAHALADDLNEEHRLACSSH